MYIGTYETEKSNCGNARTFENIPMERNEYAEVNRRFYAAHQDNWPEGCYLYPHEFALVFEYRFKNCNTKGISWIIAETMTQCESILQSRINEGRYTTPVNILYRWGKSDRNEYYTINYDVLKVDFQTIKTGKAYAYKMTLSNSNTEKAARLFYMDPDGNLESYVIAPGEKSVQINLLVKEGSIIKVSYDDYVESKPVLEIIDKLKGAIYKMVTDGEGKPDPRPAPCMCIRG